MPSFEAFENLLAPVGGVGNALLYLGLVVVVGIALGEVLARRHARHDDDGGSQ